MSEAPAVMETMPVALSLPTVPIVRPIIGTNTYRQVGRTALKVVEGLQMETAVVIVGSYVFLCSGSADIGSASCQFCRASTSLCGTG